MYASSRSGIAATYLLGRTDRVARVGKVHAASSVKAPETQKKSYFTYQLILGSLLIRSNAGY
jgi:hypothetical protein